MTRRPRHRPRAAAVALACTAFLATACGAGAPEPVAEASAEPATLQALPPSALTVVSAIDAVSQSGTTPAATSPAPGGDLDRTARDLEISSLAPTGAEPGGPTLDEAPGPASSSWAALDAASTASFDAVLVPGTPSGEPEWPADLLTLTDTEGNACVSGADYNTVRAAFAEQTSMVFDVDGALWLISLDPSLRAGC